MATEYSKDDFTVKQWEAKIDEEEARWRHLGISLDGLNLPRSEIFGLQCKVQAILNALAENDTSEENLNLQLKMIVYASMEELREHLAPQIAQAKLMQGVKPPNIVMPWQKGGNGG